jgi:REP element-mobilizing transposase RayT
LTDKLAAFVEQEICRLCEVKQWRVGVLSVQEDHIHLFPSAPPSTVLSQIAHILKGTSARKIFQYFSAGLVPMRAGGWCYHLVEQSLPHGKLVEKKRDKLHTSVLDIFYPTHMYVIQMNNFTVN